MHVVIFSGNAFLVGSVSCLTEFTRTELCRQLSCFCCLQKQDSCLASAYFTLMSCAVSSQEQQPRPANRPNPSLIRSEQISLSITGMGDGLSRGKLISHRHPLAADCWSELWPLVSGLAPKPCERRRRSTNGWQYYVHVDCRPPARFHLYQTSCLFINLCIMTSMSTCWS